MNPSTTLPRPWWLHPFWGRAWSAARLEFIPESWRDRVLFATRATSACMIALWLAFYLQLDSPYWAGMTIWMVSQPTPGMALSRGYYRFVGTIAGSIMGVVLIAFFAQTPELFIVALALWVGATTVAANLLRNFRSYGAVLAGYTAAVVALGSYTHPNHTFEIAMARGSATCIGIASITFIILLLAPHQAYAKTRNRLRDALGRAGTRAALSPTALTEQRMAIGTPLIAELIALDAEIEFAAAESPEFRIHADTARSMVAHLFGAIAAKRSMDFRLERFAALRNDDLHEMLARATALFRITPELLAEKRSAELAQELVRLREGLAQIVPEEQGHDLEQTASERVVLDRLDDLLRHLSQALEDWTSLEGGWKRTASLQLNFHRDHRIAWINGARAVLAVAAAGTFWIASAWPSGAGFVIITATACSLFSATPQPGQNVLRFATGALIALPTAFICNFYLLQNVSGFPLFALVYSLFLFPAAMFLLHPKWGLVALAYCVNFLITSRPTNPMDYNVVSFLNNGIATLSGAAFSALVYSLFLPPDPPAARRYVVNRIRQGLGRISTLVPIPSPATWQTRMFDRVARLRDPANPSGTHTDEWFESGLAAIELGNEILRLRLLLRDKPVDPAHRALAETVLATFAEWKSDPARVNRFVHAAARRLRAEPLPEGADARRCRVRMLGIFEEMEAFFDAHPKFLTPDATPAIG
jgi:uncharacterized membrane protein YccC